MLWKNTIPTAFTACKSVSIERLRKSPHQGNGNEKVDNGNEFIH